MLSDDKLSHALLSVRFAGCARLQSSICYMTAVRIIWLRLAVLTRWPSVLLQEFEFDSPVKILDKLLHSMCGSATPDARCLLSPVESRGFRV